jgi:hypothetical protein
VVDDHAVPVLELLPLRLREVEVPGITRRCVEPGPADADPLGRIDHRPLHHVLRLGVAVGLPDALDAGAQGSFQVDAAREVGIEEEHLAVQEEVGEHCHDQDNCGGDGDGDLAGESHGSGSRADDA